VEWFEPVGTRALTSPLDIVCKRVALLENGIGQILLIANIMEIQVHAVMRYAIWNNKGGVGKTFLSFVLSTEYANKHPGSHVIVADLCPQANLSEIILGGSEKGSDRLENLIVEKKTIGSYFDSRVGSPHAPSNRETDFLIHARDFN
jgi:hypothetical protein